LRIDATASAAISVPQTSVTLESEPPWPRPHVNDVATSQPPMRRLKIRAVKRDSFIGT
jgi:hypothetical protein